MAPAGCDEATEETLIETEHVRLHMPVVDYDLRERICDRSLDEIDAHVERVASDFSVVLDRKADAYVTFKLFADECPGAAAGCFLPGSDVVHATWPALYHELVHFVVDQRAQGPVFWSEAIAVAYDRPRLTGGPFAEISAEMIARDDGQPIEYEPAGHIARWLMADRGTDALVGINDGLEPTEAFGRTLPELVADYRVGAAYSYDGQRTCRGALLEPEPTGAFFASTRVDCDEEEVVNRGNVYPFKYFRLRLDAAEDFDVSVEIPDSEEIGNLGMLYCVRGSVTEEAPDSYRVGDVDTTLSHDFPWIRENHGVVQRRLEAGEYMLIVPSADGAEVRISLIPTEG